MPPTERRTRMRRDAEDTDDTDGTSEEERPPEQRTPREIALAQSRSPWARAKRWVRKRILRVA